MLQLWCGIDGGYQWLWQERQVQNSLLEQRVQALQTSLSQYILNESLKDLPIHGPCVLVFLGVTIMPFQTIHGLKEFRNPKPLDPVSQELEAQLLSRGP